MKKVKYALISVYHKDNLEPIVKALDELGVQIFSTGGTQAFIEKQGVAVTPVESLTSYPSILGGRVKTLHPKVFGGILGRRELDADVAQLAEYEIPELDLVIVDLYPFEATVAAGGAEQEIIEKIDIGGISLIRAAAKNFKDVVIVPSRDHYNTVLNLLTEQQGFTSIEDRKALATAAFNISSHYDTAIFNWFAGEEVLGFKQSATESRALRYGENPHQRGWFHGPLDELFEQLHGKELSYNNLLDVDAAVTLMAEFTNDDPTFAILKHNNACGLATRSTLAEAYSDALAGDPVSAFGGILIANRDIDLATAEKINDLFCEVVIAPGFAADAVELLKSKKNRRLLRQKPTEMPQRMFRTALNGVLEQERDANMETVADLSPVTDKQPTEREQSDLVFANKLVKHTKSNTIVLAKGNQLIASGTGQTSRVDALNQAVEKAQKFKFDLSGAVMASDAFFPFPDCVEIAHKAGITAVVQPGGSIRDKESIDYCNANGLAMVTTGVRHFKH